jgi:DNA-binding MurR/RpiR family transcriptional regulator
MPDGSSVLEAIATKADRLSPSQRRLARYIVENSTDVAFATITTLAHASGVSEATIVRFAIALGFAGYPGLQKRIQAEVRRDLVGTDRRRTADAAPPSTHPLDAVIAQEQQNIRHLLQSFDARAFDAAVSRLASACQILIIGARASASLANHLWFALDKARWPVAKATHVDTSLFETIDRLPTGSAVVVIGFPRYLADLVAVLTAAKAAGQQTITITDSPLSALTGDVTLAAPADSASFVAFQAAPLMLINALIEALVARDPAATTAALAAFETHAAARGYFHQEGRKP